MLIVMFRLNVNALIINRLYILILTNGSLRNYISCLVAINSEITTVGYQK